MALTNAQYEELMRTYQRRQLENRHRQEARINQVHQALPQLAEYEQEVSSVAVEQAKNLLNGDPDAREKLRHRLAQLREGKEVLLKMGGFPADYMEMTYTCPDCKDTGYRDGKKCHCLVQAEIELLYGQSNLREFLDRENFGTLTMEYYDRGLIVEEETGENQYDYMERIIAECRTYAASFKRSGGNLLFTGAPGTGKTFLTNCIAKELLDQSVSVLYLTAPDLFQIISDKRYDQGEEDKEERYRGILDSEFLIIDDLGTELNNSLVSAELFYCINARSLRRKATLISTNLGVSALRDAYSERVFSRILSEYRIIPFYGEDIRIRKRLKNKIS